MTDAEVICTWMGWTLPADRCPVCGWPLSDKPAGCRPGDCSMRPAPETRADALPKLFLDTLHEVEARLTDEQWYTYLCNMAGITHESIARTVWLKCLVHATPEQKIKALAAVLRPIVEGK